MIFNMLALGILSAGCPAPTVRPPRPHLLAPACTLKNVANCVAECELVNSKKNIAIRQEVTSGLNLSKYNLAVCAGQFEPIYNCYLQNLKTAACETLSNIISTENYKLVLENPNCQCSTIFS